MGNIIINSISIPVERIRIADLVQTRDVQSTELDEFKDYLEERRMSLKGIVLTAVSHAIHAGNTDSDLRIKMDDLPPEVAKAKFLDRKAFVDLAKKTGIDELTQEIKTQGLKFDIQANKNPDSSYKGKIEIIVPSEMLRGLLGKRAIIFDKVNLLGFMLGHLLKEQVVKGYSDNVEETLEEARASYNYNKRISLEFDLDIPENSSLDLHPPEITLEDIYYLLNGDLEEWFTDEGKALFSIGFFINHIYEEYLIKATKEPFTFTYVKEEIERNPEEWNCRTLEKTPIADNEDLITAYIERLKEIVGLAV